ncbi:hypothetical Protein YC6258_04164 [Gynuella sunshinyii YC6258]|uniref:Uncharacterized protein n=1 Tax=Gynuella sunshinyii YC6258 TaxID=1445510 RepID=A0A0C5VA29_9GAMM|nr:hypothetical Protein YC6258_04164 [Gynuella sunshinyii YC6258]
MSVFNIQYHLIVAVQICLQTFVDTNSKIIFSKSYTAKIP